MLFLIFIFIILNARIQCYSIQPENQCFPNNWCLNGTSIIGLRWNMTIVPGTALQCGSQIDCLNKLCKINDIPQVSWVAFRITAN